VYGIPNLGTFNITRPGDGNHAASGRLMPTTLSVGPAAGQGESPAAMEGALDGPGVSEVSAGSNEGAHSEGEIVITVKGKVSVGNDDYGIFKVGRNLAGKDFTLVMTFSRAATQHQHMCIDKADGTSYLGSAKDVPAKAILSIGDGSFVFGAQPDSSWGAFRGLTSDCMEDRVVLSFKEGAYPQATLLWVKLQPSGRLPLNTSISWDSALSSSQLDQSPNLSSFGISHSGDYEHSDHGVLIPDSVSIQVGGASVGPQTDSSQVPADREVSEQGGGEAAQNSAGPAAAANGGPQSTDGNPKPSLQQQLKKGIGRWLPKISAPSH
jgi:hypothetical protein